MCDSLFLKYTVINIFISWKGKKLLEEVTISVLQTTISSGHLNVENKPCKLGCIILTTNLCQVYIYFQDGKQQAERLITLKVPCPNKVKIKPHFHLGKCSEVGSESS
jgi:hypothetical protein